MVVGAAVATGSVLARASVAGFSSTIVGSMAPKCVTAPVAIELARALGDDPALAAGRAVMTGPLGARRLTAVRGLARIPGSGRLGCLPAHPSSPGRRPP